MKESWNAEALVQMPTPALQEILRKDLDSVRSLSAEQALCICRILASRSPMIKEEVRASWNRFLTNYEIN